jgi:hypothetical protein
VDADTGWQGKAHPYLSGSRVAWTAGSGAMPACIEVDSPLRGTLGSERAYRAYNAAAEIVWKGHELHEAGPPTR